MESVRALARETTISAACVSLSLPRATYYRRENQRQHILHRVITRPPLSLSPTERQNVLETLNSERFIDTSPSEVHATLLDEGRYLCSVRTMYRLLHEGGEVKERRQQRINQIYHKPELLAR